MGGGGGYLHGAVHLTIKVNVNERKFPKNVKNFFLNVAFHFSHITIT